MIDINNRLDPVDPYGDIPDYTKYVESGYEPPEGTELDEKLYEITLDRPGPRYDQLPFGKQITPFFEIVRDIDYEPSTGDVSMPEETLRRGYGDREDQLVLLANLLTVEEPRFVVCDDIVSLEFKLRGRGPDYDKPDIETFAEAYNDMGRETNGFRYEVDSGFWVDDWYIVADPIYSDYIGDISELENAGFIKETRGGWGWRNFRCYQTTD